MPTDSNLFNRQAWFVFFGAIAFLSTGYYVMAVLHFIIPPMVLFLLGVISYCYHSRRALFLFFFLLPLVNAVPDLFLTGLPFNYFGMALFYLAGLTLAVFIKKEKLLLLEKWSSFYLIFLAILNISALFVWLRWSNILYSSRAFLKDTPVSLAGERVSFAAIFPLITLFIFSISPFIIHLLKANRMTFHDVKNPLFWGFSFSLGLAILQRFWIPDFLSQRWWVEKLGQPNGGFSDFNAFGFFSGALFLYLCITLVKENSGGLQLSECNFQNENKYQRLKNGFFLLASLLGVFFSGSRTALLFILFAIVFAWVKLRIPLKTRFAILVFFIMIFMLLGGTLKNRIWKMTELLHTQNQNKNFVQLVDSLSNKRIQMIIQSLPIITNYPVCGVGTGNYLFHFRSIHYQENIYEDLPLNQYLLVLDELGVIGLTVFMAFLFFFLKSMQNNHTRFIILAFLIVFWVGTPLWLPEVMVLFFALSVTQNTMISPVQTNKGMMLLAVFFLILFVATNALAFNSLMVPTLARKTNLRYDYGLWYTERSEDGKEFNWSKENTGIYIELNKKGFSNPITVGCGAPLLHFPGRHQDIHLYWKGESFRVIRLDRNERVTFTIIGKPNDNGLLEFKIYPVFSPKTFKLSAESRTLGVQIFNFSTYSTQ
jgi:hypothetical protein